MKNRSLKTLQLKKLLIVKLDDSRKENLIGGVSLGCNSQHPAYGQCDLH